MHTNIAHQHFFQGCTVGLLYYGVPIVALALAVIVSALSANQVCGTLVANLWSNCGGRVVK
jgi:hypothetical protein